MMGDIVSYMELEDRLKIMHEERHTQVRYLRIAPGKWGVTAEDLREAFELGGVGSRYVLESVDKHEDGSWEFALEVTNSTMRLIEPGITMRPVEPSI